MERDLDFRVWSKNKQGLLGRWCMGGSNTMCVMNNFDVYFDISFKLW